MQKNILINYSISINVITINQSISFYFHDAKEHMRVAAKDQLVIESAAPYRSKLTTPKLPNVTMKKKKEKVTSMF